MTASTVLRTVHHASGLAGLAMIGGSFWIAWARFWDPTGCAAGFFATLLGLKLVLEWWRARHNGYLNVLDGEETAERLVSGEDVGDDRPGASKASLKTFKRLVNARRFLPTPLPAGWSRPVNPCGSACWHLSAGSEKLLVSQKLEDDEPGLVQALIFPPAGCKEPVATDRCMDILEPLKDVQEWFEVPFNPEPRVPTARSFIAAPHGMLVRQADRAMPRPDATRKPLSRWLRAVRERHLPEKLPAGWSAPIARLDDDIWMFEVDDFLVLAGYCVDEDRSVKLSVLLAAGEKFSEEDATSILGKMRNVREFVPVHVEEPAATLYFAEVVGGDLPLQAPTKAEPVLN